MSRKWMLVLTVGFVIMATGCQDKPVEVTDPSPQEEIIDQEETVVEEGVIEEPVVPYDEAFKALLESGDQVGMRLFLIENGKAIEKEELDQMIHAYIALLESNYGAFTDLYFTGDDYEVHINMMDVHNQHGDQFRSNRAFTGTDKYKVLDYLKRDVDKELVTKTFDAGYGLFMAEGSYYPVIDFKELNEYLGMFVTDTMGDYMSLVAEDIDEPLTAEEYLAVNVSDLKNRAYAYESFIREHPDFENVTYIRNNLMVALYKFSGPNIFDGMLTDEFKLTEEMRGIYESIIEENMSPILVEVAEKVLAFSDERDGVFGSFENMDDLYEFASETHAAASEQVDALISN